MKTHAIRIACCASLLLAAATALPAERGLLDVKVSTVTVRGVKGVRVVPAEGGEPLVEPNGQPLFTRGACKVDYRVEPAPGGFDLLAAVNNPTKQPQKRPRFLLRGVRLGTAFTYLDARSLGHLYQREVQRGKPIFWFGMTYPDDLYAPVVMMHNDRFAVGVSLIYDLLTEKHHVRGQCYTEGGAWFGTAGIGFDLHVDTPRHRSPQGRVLIEPGATQRYRFTVRFAKPGTWRAALEPYRQHFRKRWGGVRYEADLRPVYGETMALTKFINAENPRGYHPKRRYDRLGWKPMVDEYMTKAVANGYRRVMVWCASGLYSTGSNYPPEFMTEWPQKLIDTAAELTRLKQAGATLGMWWGRAGQVSGGWNTGKMWDLDVRKPSDVAAAMAELRLAAQRGTDEVGLDAVSYIPTWDRVAWIPRIQTAVPKLRFITEPANCDILHTLAPTFMTFARQHDPPVLADWLNPGHESWIMLRWQEVNQANFDKIVGWRCVPVTMSRAVKHDATRFQTPAALKNGRTFAADFEAEAKVTLRGARIAKGGGLNGGNALLLPADGYAEIDRKTVNPHQGTIAFWVRPDRDPLDGSQTWMSWGWGKTGWPYMILSNGWWEKTGGRGRLYAVIDNTTIGGVSSPADLAAGQWSHYAVTWRSAPQPAVHLYENGRLLASHGHNVKPLPADRAISTPVYLGADLGSSLRGGRRGHASLDELRIYSRPLDPHQIGWLFRRRAPLEVVERSRDPLAWMGDAIDKPPRETRDKDGRLLESRAIFDEGSHYLRSPKTIDTVIDRIHRAGFNVFIPCVYHGWGAHYQTKPEWMSTWASTFKKNTSDFNALEHFIERAHAKGIQVHSWFCVFLDESTRRKVKPTFPASSVGGHFYNGYDPAFRDAIVALILDHAARYKVDGINLDYIRLGGGLKTDAAAKEYRRLFARDLKADLRDRKRMAAFAARCVDDVVRRVREGLDKIRPGIVLSVDAVPGLTHEGLASNGRNPERWIDNGWIDVAYYMCYSRRLALPRMDRVRAQSKRPAGHVFIVGNYDQQGGKLVPRPGLPRLLDYCRRKYNDGNGVAVYIYSLLSAEQIPALRAGPFKELARPHWANRAARPAPAPPPGASSP